MFINVTSGPFFVQIKLANQTASTAARQIREAIAKLSSIGDRRAVVESKLGEHFRARLANNSATLTQINAVTNELLRLVERAQTLRSQARQNVSGAQAEIDAAADTVRMRKSEAHAALVSALGAEGNVSQAHEAARDADNVTTHFKVSQPRWLFPGRQSYRAKINRKDWLQPDRIMS